MKFEDLIKAKAKVFKLPGRPLQKLCNNGHELDVHGSRRTSWNPVRGQRESRGRVCLICANERTKKWRKEAKRKKFQNDYN